MTTQSVTNWKKKQSALTLILKHEHLGQSIAPRAQRQRGSALD